MKRNDLAIHGGKPSCNRMPPRMLPGGNSIGKEEEDAVIDVVRRKRLFRFYGATDGPSRVAEFERAFCQYMDVPYAISVNTGTSSLMCGLAGIGLEPGDEVIVPAYTWISSPAAVAIMGGIPIIAEVDETLTLDPADVAGKITPRTKAIMVVHMRGASARMDELLALAREHHLYLVEDTAQSCGASYKGKKLGTMGDVGCFSLQFQKIITCGDGGVTICSNVDTFKRCIMLHDVVAGTREGFPRLAPDDLRPAMNLRMPELSGAVALVQLGRLDGLLTGMRQRKQAMKNGMRDALQSAGGSFRSIVDEKGDASIALIFFLPSIDQTDFAVKALRAENIDATFLYRPDCVDNHVYAHWRAILNKQTWTDRGGPWRWGEPVEYSRDMCPSSLDLLSRAVHIDVNPLLSMEEIDQIVAGLDKVLNAL